MSADLLAPNTGYCLYISSISAYASFAKPNDIGSPTGVLENKDQEEITNETYGPMKALCEQYVRDAYGARSSIVRPGYIVGPLDPTDRFTYWPVRFAQGGDMAVPGTPADPIQIVDVRDLVAFMLGLVERRVDGFFNAVTPPGAITMGNLMDTSRKVTGADPKLTWIDEDFLAKFLKPEEMNFAPWGPMHGEEAGGSLTGMKASPSRASRRARSRRPCATRSPGTRRGRPIARRRCAPASRPSAKPRFSPPGARGRKIPRRSLRGDSRCAPCGSLLEGKKPGVVTIDAGEPVRTAIQLMADHFIGALPVLEGGRLAGIVSERDYARKVVLMGRKSTETTVGTIMSSPVIHVGPAQTVNECMMLMTEKRIRHLPVVDDGELVGVISIGDS